MLAATTTTSTALPVALCVLLALASLLCLGTGLLYLVLAAERRLSVRLLVVGALLGLVYLLGC